MVDNYDIGNDFSDRETTLFNLLKLVQEKVQEDNRLHLVYINDDVYIQRLLEYFYDNTHIVNIDKVETIYDLDLTPIFNNFIFSEELSKIILEKIFTEDMFMVINTVNLTNDNILDNIDLGNIYDEIIDSGLVRGEDVVKLLSKDIAIHNMKTFIVEVSNIMRDNKLPNSNLIFLGWLKLGRVLFLKYNTVME